MAVDMPARLFDVWNELDTRTDTEIDRLRAECDLDHKVDMVRTTFEHRSAAAHVNGAQFHSRRG